MTDGLLLLKERYRSLLDTVVSPDVATELLKGDLRLGGETRQVTTLFADVRGFTTLTEHLPPEQVIGMLNEWLELAATVIAEEGGIVDKYVGDMVMAVFGAPMADQAHALRAVRAAVRLRDVTAERRPGASATRRGAIHDRHRRQYGPGSRRQHGIVETTELHGAGCVGECRQPAVRGGRPGRGPDRRRHTYREVAAT